MTSYSRTFKQHGSYCRWMFYKTPSGKAMKQLFYYHRLSRSWKPSKKFGEYVIRPHRGGSDE